MKNIKFLLTILGVAIILFAPLLGNELSACYLILSGGMETEKYIRIIDGGIRSFQIIGTLLTVYSLFGHKNRES